MGVGPAAAAENLTGEEEVAPGEQIVMPSAFPVTPQLGKAPVLSFDSNTSDPLVVVTLNKMSGLLPVVVRTT